MPAPESTINRRKRSFADMNAPDPDTQEMPSDTLIPIRLDVTVDNHRIQETFSWNPLEKQVSPQAFAIMLAADLNLPSMVHEPIVEQITEQIAAHTMPTNPFPSNTTAPQESRHIVHLDVRMGRLVVRDKFEWDLRENLNAADIFAERLCADLGLSTEHVPMVAHALRKQLVELMEFQDKRHPCPVLSEQHVLRATVDAWQPAVECLTVEQQEKLERKEKREARLQRRNRGKADLLGRSNARANGRPVRGRGSRRRNISRQTY